MRKTIRITDIEALAAFENGKYVTSEEIKIIKHTPLRTLIRAALTLGIKVPGVEESNADEGGSPPASGKEGVASVPTNATPSDDFVQPEFTKKKS